VGGSGMNGGPYIRIPGEKVWRERPASNLPHIAIRQASSPAVWEYTHALGVCIIGGYVLPRSEET